MHKKEHPPASKMLKKWRCHPDSDRGMKVLQTFIQQDIVVGSVIEHYMLWFEK